MTGWRRNRKEKQEEGRGIDTGRSGASRSPHSHGVKDVQGRQAGEWPRPHGDGSWRGRRTCTSAWNWLKTLDLLIPVLDQLTPLWKHAVSAIGDSFRKKRPRQNRFKAKPISYISAGQCLSLAWECLNFWSTLVFSVTKLYPGILLGKSLLLKLKLNKRVHYPDYNSSLQKSRGKRLHVWKNCSGSQYVSGLNLYLFCKGKILILYCKNS